MICEAVHNHVLQWTKHAKVTLSVRSPWRNMVKGTLEEGVPKLKTALKQTTDKILQNSDA